MTLCIVSFTDEEVNRIADESQTFAAKIATMAASKEDGIVLSMSSTEIDREAEEYFQTIYPKNGLTTCVHLLRVWAHKKGYKKLSSLAGAKKKVTELADRAKEGTE
jgi:hypothetical protein